RGCTALDVEELLPAEVEPEPGLGDDVVGITQRQARRQDAVTAVRDVAEGAAVHEGRHPFHGLHQVRLERVFEDDGHGVRRLYLAGGYRFFFAGETDNDTRQAPDQIGRAAGQGENRHHLGGGGDVEAFLTRHAHEPPAQADDDLPQGTVVHVHDPAPADLPHIEIDRAVEQGVVQHSGQQVVGRGDGV